MSLLRTLWVWACVAAICAGGDQKAPKPVLTVHPDQVGFWIEDPQQGSVTLVGGAGTADPDVRVRRDAFTRGASTLIIRANCLACQVSAGGTETTLDIDRDEDNFLEIDGRVDRMKVRLNGRDLLTGKVGEAWARLLTGDGAEPIRIVYPGATDVMLRYLPPGRRNPDLFPDVPARVPVTVPDPELTPAPVPALPPVAAPGFAPAPPTEVRRSVTPRTASEDSEDPSIPEAIRGAARGVYSIRGVDPRGRPLSVGSAFVVDADGFAATSYRVLEGCAGAKALLDGQSIPVELWAVDPNMDLAIIRIDPKKHPAAQSLRPLVWSPSTYVPENQAWSIGFAAQKRRIVQDMMSVTHDAAQLPDHLRLALPDARRGAWLMHSSPLEREMSGGPVVDSHGRVVGINVRTPLGASGSSAALGYSDLKRLAERRRQAPVGFDRAWPAATRAASMGEPPWLEIDRVAPAQQIKRYVLTLQRDAVCSTCKGLGTVKTKVLVGYRTVAGNLRRPVYENRTGTCEKCRGTKLSETRGWDYSVSKLTESVATLDPEDPDGEAQLSEMERTLSIVFDSRSKFSTRALDKLFSGERGAKPGTPIAATGRLFEARGPQGRIMVLRTSDDQFVAVTDPAYHVAERTSQVLVAGLYAGDIDLGGGKRVPVAQGGFILPLRLLGQSIPPPNP